MSSETDFLKELFHVAIATAHPSNCLATYLPKAPRGQTVVVGAGKAAASMAQVVEQNWPWSLSGLVVTRYGHAAQCNQIEVWEAAHPVPDETGVQAAKKMIDMVRPLSTDDLVLVLISGGGSALLTLPAQGISLEDKQKINSALLKSGANIYEMNCVRKHLSAIKGGQFARYCAPAAVTCLMISDVPGDDPSTIASGPTVGDATTRRQALGILEQYNITITPSIRAHLESTHSETPKPGDPIFSRVSNIVIATASNSLTAASNLARQRGVETLVLGDDLQGEARELGKAHAKLVMRQSRPVLLLSGGETTVTVSGTGRGGRNVEYLLALAIELDRTADIYALAADTDGIDGSEVNAGAVFTPTTLARARAKNLNPQDYLSNNDAYSFFAELGDLLTTGPTLTNVNDFRAIYVAR
ncbi:MAG: glycerate kinase [Arenicellales bacterium]|nr:glycerate kinase [Arenicellales bacterium]